MEFGSFDLIASLVFTWSVGLGLPALVRFLLYRRPLLPTEALPWTIGLGLAEAALFIALGSQSKTHAVLILIGWIAYKILKRPVGPLDSLAATSVNATSTAHPGNSDAPASNGERVGFRVVLLSWFTGAVLLLASGISYIQWQSASSEVDTALGAFRLCEERLQAEHPTCRIVNGNFVTFDQCISLRNAKCGAQSFSAVAQQRDIWHERAALLFVFGASLLIIPSLLFYAVRWAFTGRTRPLWINK